MHQRTSPTAAFQQRPRELTGQQRLLYVPSSFQGKVTSEVDYSTLCKLSNETAGGQLGLDNRHKSSSLRRRIRRSFTLPLPLVDERILHSCDRFFDVRHHSRLGLQHGGMTRVRQATQPEPE